MTIFCFPGLWSNLKLRINSQHGYRADSIQEFLNKFSYMHYHGQNGSIFPALLDILHHPFNGRLYTYISATLNNHLPYHTYNDLCFLMIKYRSIYGLFHCSCVHFIRSFIQFCQLHFRTAHCQGTNTKGTITVTLHPHIVTVVENCDRRINIYPVLRTTSFLSRQNPACISRDYLVSNINEILTCRG